MILVARPYGPGGVANYYDAIGPHLPANVKFCTVHNPQTRRFWEKILSFPEILRRYVSLLHGAEAVCLNPSLYPNSYYRDLLLLVLARMLRKRTIVFFRGWDEEFEQRIMHRRISRYMFNNTYGKADRIIVLGSIFREKLLAIGVSQKREIIVDTTVAEPPTLTEQEIVEKFTSFDSLNILFLSRIVNSKGIHEALDIYMTLKANLSVDATLTIVGDGPDLKTIRRRVSSEEIRDVYFTGDIRGNRKQEVFRDKHVLLFPSHSEGMPNVVLEAMAQGLFIVSTPVGGVPDIIRDGENGLLIDLKDIEGAAAKVSIAITDGGFLAKCCIENYRIAAQRFTPKAVSERFLSIVSAK